MKKPDRKSKDGIGKPFYFLWCIYILSSVLLVNLCYLFITLREMADLSRASAAFFYAINREKEIYISSVDFQYSALFSPDSISEEETRCWHEQSFLIKGDPKRLHLDSIFQAELEKQQIKASVAIRCKVGENEFLSQPVAFYSKAISLDGVSYRKDFDPAHTIILQPYVYFSYVWLIDCWPISFLAVVWLISTLFFAMLIRKRIVKPKSSSVIQVKQYVDTVYTPSVKVQWLTLPGNIYFDEVHGILEQGENRVSLSGDSLLYFRCFIQKENFMLTYQEILGCIYGIKSDILSKNDRSKISHGVGRLQKQLQPFSHIEVILIRGKGYQLVMTSNRSEWSS